MAFKKNSFDESFITPMSEQRLAAEPGPDVFSVPVNSPTDPLGVVPGGSRKGPIDKTSTRRSLRAKGKGGY